jgi:hypothetical protein
VVISNTGFPFASTTGVFTMVFSDVVNAENSNDNIGGNVSFRANVDLDKCNSEHESKYNLYGDGASQTAEIIFGKMTSEISGIDVTGKFNPEDTTVVWTISAGTNNKGTNLNGADLDVSFDSEKLEYKEAYIMVGGEKVPVELTGSEGKYTYRVTDSVKDGFLMIGRVFTDFGLNSIASDYGMLGLDVFD